MRGIEDADGQRFRKALRWVGPALLTALLLAGFGVAFASRVAAGPANRTADSSPTATASPLDAASPTPAPAATPTAANATSTLAPTATQTPSSAGVPAATATPWYMGGVFHLKTVTITANSSDDFTHTCAARVDETFNMTLVAAPDGPGQTVTYYWSDFSGGDESQSHTATVTFAPGEVTKTVTFEANYGAGMGDGSSLQDNIHVNYPDEAMFGDYPTIQHATFAFTCVRQLTNLTFVPSISSWSAPCGNFVNFTMKWTVTATPGPRIFVDFGIPTYTPPPSFADWMAPHTFQAALDATSDLDPGTQDSGVITNALNTAAPNGAYWMQVATTSPEVLTARATIVKAC